MARLRSRGFRLLHSICIQMKGHFTFTGACSLCTPSPRAPRPFRLTFLTFVHLVPIALVCAFGGRSSSRGFWPVPSKVRWIQAEAGPSPAFWDSGLPWGLFLLNFPCSVQPAFVVSPLPTLPCRDTPLELAQGTRKKSFPFSASLPPPGGGLGF